MASGLNWYPADSPPKNPQEGDAYYDSNFCLVRIYNGKRWAILARTTYSENMQVQVLLYPCDHGYIAVELEDTLPESLESNKVIANIGGNV